MSAAILAIGILLNAWAVGAPRTGELLNFLPNATQHRVDVEGRSAFRRFTPIPTIGARNRPDY
jgi:hypothetical protein